MKQNKSMKLWATLFITFTVEVAPQTPQTLNPDFFPDFPEMRPADFTKSKFFQARLAGTYT